MNVHRLSKDDLYTEVAAAVKNAQADPVITQNLERMLWTDANNEEGERLLEECQALEAASARVSGQKKGATANFHDLVSDTYDAYMDLITVCRGEIRDETLRATLELDARRERTTSFGAWLNQTERFLSNALDPAVWSQLEELGFSEDMFSSLRDRVLQVASLKRAQSRHRSDSDDVNETLQQVRQELRTWFVRFLQRSRRALRDHPQKLEAIGISMEANLVE